MPEPPNRDKWLKQHEAFLQGLAKLHDDEKVELFFGDEAGFEGNPRPPSALGETRLASNQGYYGGHVRENVVGAVNPTTGQLVNLIVPHCDTDTIRSVSTVKLAQTHGLLANGLTSLTSPTLQNE